MTTTVLKRDSRGRVRRSAAQRAAVLDEWDRSGLSGVAFARLSGINYQTLATWRQQRRLKRGEVCAASSRKCKPLRLVEAAVDRSLAMVTAASPATSSLLSPACGTASTTLEVVLPGGAFARMINLQQAGLLAELLKALA